MISSIGCSRSSASSRGLYPNGGPIRPTGRLSSNGGSSYLGELGGGHGPGCSWCAETCHTRTNGRDADSSANEPARFERPGARGRRSPLRRRDPPRCGSVGQRYRRDIVRRFRCGGHSGQAEAADKTLWMPGGDVGTAQKTSCPDQPRRRWGLWPGGGNRRSRAHRCRLRAGRDDPAGNCCRARGCARGTRDARRETQIISPRRTMTWSMMP